MVVWKWCGNTLSDVAVKWLNFNAYGTYFVTMNTQEGMVLYLVIKKFLLTSYIFGISTVGRILQNLLFSRILQLFSRF